MDGVVPFIRALGKACRAALAVVVIPVSRERLPPLPAKYKPSVAAELLFQAIAIDHCTRAYSSFQIGPSFAYPGADTDEIVTELGLDAAALRRAGGIA